MAWAGALSDALGTGLVGISDEGASCDCSQPQSRHVAVWGGGGGRRWCHTYLISPRKGLWGPRLSILCSVPSAQCMAVNLPDSPPTDLHVHGPNLKSVQSTLSHLISTSVPLATFTCFFAELRLFQ